MSVRTYSTPVRTELLSARLYARVTEAELASWKAQASARGMVFSDWLRSKLNNEGTQLDKTAKKEILVISLACDHPEEPGKPGKCNKWGCKNYAYAR